MSPKDPPAPPPVGPPPEPPGPSPSGPSDADQLREALVLIRTVLDDFVNGGDPAVSPRLLDAFQSAWPDVQRAFRTVDQRIGSGNAQQQLTEAGLTGASLRLKVSGLRGAFTRLLRGGAPGFRRRARYFLAWGNTILGSVAAVITPAELIKEYKECVEHDLAEQDADGE